MRKYRLLFLGIMVIVLTGSRFWFEDDFLVRKPSNGCAAWTFMVLIFLCTFWCVIWPLQGFYSFCPIQCMDGLQ